MGSKGHNEAFKVIKGHKMMSTLISGQICIICIPFDRKFDFKFSQINGFEILWNRLRKILKITIREFRFRSTFQMSHIYDSHA